MIPTGKYQDVRELAYFRQHLNIYRKQNDPIYKSGKSIHIRICGMDVWKMLQEYLELVLANADSHTVNDVLFYLSNQRKYREKIKQNNLRFYEIPMSHLDYIENPRDSAMVLRIFDALLNVGYRLSKEQNLFDTTQIEKLGVFIPK